MTSPYMLNWNESESIECGAQAIITNRSNHVWISCQRYIGRGIITVNENGDPIGMTILLWNNNPLDGPRNVSNIPQYDHIGDGDYVHITATGEREIWFGLEDGTWPTRVYNAAIARYNADTLEFIGLHIHPYMRTMAFLAFHEQRQVAYTFNWTENYGELVVFDVRTMDWVNKNASIDSLPPAFHEKDIQFVQGSVMDDNNILYLMVDDYVSTLLAVEMMNQHQSESIGNEEKEESYGGRFVSESRLGLGHEREGISIFFTNTSTRLSQPSWLLAIGNQAKTWEGTHFAGVVRVSLFNNTGAPTGMVISFANRTTSFMGGMVAGVLISVILGLLLFRCLCNKHAKRNNVPTITIDKNQPNVSYAGIVHDGENSFT